MPLTQKRRNEIAWQFLVFKAREKGAHQADFNSAEIRQRIRVTAEKLNLSFEEALEFAKEVLDHATM
ncbi:MAG: hypothetical protein WEC84_01550 [Candidatus Andersenbacteria bacterium]